jgi:hypothetical protein
MERGVAASEWIYEGIALYIVGAKAKTAFIDSNSATTLSLINSREVWSDVHGSDILVHGTCVQMLLPSSHLEACREPRSG